MAGGVADDGDDSDGKEDGGPAVDLAAIRELREEQKVRVNASCLLFAHMNKNQTRYYHIDCILLSINSDCRVCKWCCSCSCGPGPRAWIQRR